MKSRDVYLQVSAAVFAAFGVVAAPFAYAAVVCEWRSASMSGYYADLFTRLIYVTAPPNLILSSIGMFFLKKWGHIYGFITATILCGYLLYLGLIMWFKDVTFASYCLLGAWFFFDVCRHLVRKRAERLSMAR